MTCLQERADLLRSIEHSAGPLRPLLAIAELSELVVNPDGRVWWAGGTAGYRRADLRMLDGPLRNLCRYAATWAERALDEQTPALSIGPLPLAGRRYRATIVGPPLAERLALCLRRIPEEVPRLESYVETGRIAAPQAARLVETVRRGEAVLVVGPQRSGKTTFAAALLGAVLRQDPGLRTAIIEDTPEIRVDAATNVLALATTSRHGLGELVALALRTGSDLVCVGEIRDQGVRHLLDAFLSGHGGLSTFHAASAAEALQRIALLAGAGSPAAVAAAVPHVVVLRRTHVTEIAETHPRT